MIHWLTNTIEPKVIQAATYTITAGLVTTLLLTPFRHVLKKVWRAFDSLDPTTDTGVTKELKELKQELEELRQQ